MKDILTLLRENSGVDDFLVTKVDTVSYEVFFVHRKLETVRATDTGTCHVTVYVDHDGKKGDSSFPLYDSMTEDEIRGKIGDAVKRANLVFNEPYEIPSGGEKTAELPTDLAREEMPALAAKIADAVFAADDIEGGSINATEIFLYRDTVRVRNSRGIDKTQIKYRAMIEAIPTWNEGEESVELYEQYRFTSFDAKAVTERMAERMREVRDRHHAKKPASPLSCPVLLRPHEISELMGELASDVNYASVYAHANLYHTGDDLQTDGDGDKLTVTMRGAIPGSDSSASFDGDGVELTDSVIVRDGVVGDGFGSHRFASYLGKPVTGNLPCLEVEKGTLTEKDLSATPILDCVSLSGLQVDLYNDYIGGEIRLAYYFDGKTVRPVTGISMSGKLSECLKHLRLSDRVVTLENYRGPDRLMLSGMAIL